MGRVGPHGPRTDWWWQPDLSAGVRGGSYGAHGPAGGRVGDAESIHRQQSFLLSGRESLILTGNIGTTNTLQLISMLHYFFPNTTRKGITFLI